MNREPNRLSILGEAIIAVRGALDAENGQKAADAIAAIYNQARPGMPPPVFGPGRPKPGRRAVKTDPVLTWVVVGGIAVVAVIAGLAMDQVKSYHKCLETKSQAQCEELFQ